MSISILLDGKGLQTQFQSDYHTRLASLFETFDANDFNYEISDINVPVTPDMLLGYDVFMITSRYKKGGTGSNPDPDFYYTQEELLAIQDFVQAGKGLLLMSNHSTSTGNPNNITMYDLFLADVFGVALDQTFWIQMGSNTTLSGSQLNTASPVITGGKGVKSIVINDCCSLTGPDEAVIIATINPDMVDRHDPSESNTGQPFALSLEGSESTGAGRVIITADSGFLGSCGDPNPVPGPGQYCYGDNAVFMTNVINWLTGNL